ncbi:MAG TPA: phosphatidylglycerophosphatase A [Mariprofundaceae bacterium]|nr:phosphatidylglycerophosphatase A [Mariprofundaceae bacterium]
MRSRLWAADSTILADFRHSGATLQMARWVASGFGSGYLPKAPGTWGSLAALPFAWWVWLGFGAAGLWLGTVVLMLAGCVACAVVLRDVAETDPGWIVMDEWAGQWCCLALVADMVPLNLWWLIAGFIAFRLFDIWKPWPISRMERWGAPWWAIMIDDMGAGLFGGVILMLGGRVL